MRSYIVAVEQDKTVTMFCNIRIDEVLDPEESKKLVLGVNETKRHVAYVKGLTYDTAMALKAKLEKCDEAGNGKE